MPLCTPRPVRPLRFSQAKGCPVTADHSGVLLMWLVWSRRRSVLDSPFTGLSPRCFGKLVTHVRRGTAGDSQRGRPWSLPLEDRVLLVAAYWRTSLTLRQLGPLFGVSKSAADRIIGHLGPKLAFQSRRRFRQATVLIVDGTLGPTRDHTVPSSRRTTVTRPTTRSSSMPTPASSWWSADRCPATATTAERGRNPERRTPSVPR